MLGKLASAGSKLTIVLCAAHCKFAISVMAHGKHQGGSCYLAKQSRIRLLALLAVPPSGKAVALQVSPVRFTAGYGRPWPLCSRSCHCSS